MPASILATSLPCHAQAILALDAANSLVRGSTSTIKVRCKELIDLTYSLPDEKDDKGKKTASGKTITVKREEILFEKEIPFVIEKEYAPGSQTIVKAQLEIPVQLPPTARGKLSQVKWEAEAQGDVVGKFWDATSGWQEVTVK